MINSLFVQPVLSVTLVTAGQEVHMCDYVFSDTGSDLASGGHESVGGACLARGDGQWWGA